MQKILGGNVPYKSEKFKLQGLQDRRRKLTDEQKQEIKELYATGNYSLNKLAKEYEVSKKLILLIVNPESKAKNDLYIKEHWREFQETKEKHNESIKNTRRYKQQLYLKGELKESANENSIYIQRNI